MMVQIAFHNVDQSNALKHFLIQKTQKLQRFLDKDFPARWIIDSDGKNFIPRLNLKAQGKNISLHAKASNAFVATSEILSKAKNLLSRMHVPKRKMRVKLS